MTLEPEHVQVLRSLRSESGGLPETSAEEAQLRRLEDQGLVYEGLRFWHLTTRGLRALLEWEASQP